VLNFQRMDVYRCAIEFLAFSTQLPEVLPKGHAALADQLRRAALSVPLNIAEAAGRATDADTARHYAIARGSAMECAAVIDAFRVLEVLDERQYHTAIDLLERIASMLTRLCRRE
jgi:four helix bundle protein